MNRKLIFATIAAAVAIAPAYADNTGDHGQAAAGRVETVLVKEARGFFIEKKLLRKTDDKEIWVEVRFPASYLSGPDTNVFQVPENVALERGDIVMAEIADQSPRVFKLIAGENQVTSLVAKRDTLQALLFDVRSRRVAFNPFMQTYAASGGNAIAVNTPELR